jgi:CheY-like chemotaxis protein
MSYPLALQPLVIEDDKNTKEAYQEIFSSIAEENATLPFSTAPPHFAFSYGEAVECLEKSKIFHVVILDLQLPEKRKIPAVSGVDFGMKLLDLCLQRDRYPIPALLVISGHIGATDQTRMQETLRRGFYCGRPLVKGPHLGEEIRLACREAFRYCAVGIHLRDAGDQRYPTISPREEDLLRRSVLDQNGCVALDLDWWSAQQSQGFSVGGAAKPWTKVLMGRYVLGEGGGASTPKFFKLMTGSDAEDVIKSARRLAQKLAHVKLTNAITSRTRALIVTEKVGAQDARPKMVEEFLDRATPKEAYEVAGQVAEQVGRLGEILPESRVLKTILWPFHDRRLLEEQWVKFGPEVEKSLGAKSDPLELFEELKASPDRLDLNEMSVVHGDLHIRNIAFDIRENRVEAYIFDAGIMKQNVAGRDLAVLEASLMLHQRFDAATFAKICSILYGSTEPLTDDSDSTIENPVARNTIQFIRALRERAHTWNEPDRYALMVFDFALIQVGGLKFGSSGNMISDHRSAVYLLATTAEWYRKLRK